MSHKITYPISAPSTIPTEYTVAFYDLSIPSEQSWVWTIEFMMPDGEMKDNVMVSKGEGLVNISWPLNYTSFEMATLHVKAMTIATEIGRLLKHLPEPLYQRLQQLSNLTSRPFQKYNFRTPYSTSNSSRIN